MLLENLTKDVRHGLRILTRAPGFAFAAVISLALGIGANTAMFSVVHAVLLRPLPYPDADRLVTLWSDNTRAGITQQTSSYGNVDDWRRSARSFSGVAAYDPVSIIVTSGEPRRTSGLLASPNLAHVLQIQPQLGRMFTEEEAARRDPVAVLTHAAWQTHHAGAADILGRQIEINRRPTTIVGVLPAGIHHDTELWLPDTLASDGTDPRAARGVGPWRALARLAPGVTVDAAQTEMSAIAAALAREFPDANHGLGVRVVPLAEHVVGPNLRKALVLLLAAVAAVLLIACSNVANLLLARGLARQREFALRLSLGATRGRLVAQLLVENTVLCLLAAVAGSALAWVAVDVVRAFPANVPRLDTITLDPRMLAFAVALSLTSACLFGLLPALKSTRRDTLSMLRDGARGATDGPRGRRLRGVLVVAEFALAVILFAGAGMLVRSLAHLLAVDPGFRTDGVLVMGVRFSADRAEEETIPFAAAVVERVSALPGVAAAAICEEVLLGERAQQTISAEGATADETAAVRLSLGSDAVTPDYFRVMGVPLRRGRFFTTRDDADAPPVVILNEALARRLWPDGDALGRRLRIGGAGSTQPWVTVVGIVGDQRRQGLDRAAIPQAFWPLPQRPTRSMILVVWTHVEPTSLADAVRRTVRSVDATVPLNSFGTLRQEIDRTLAPRRFQTGLLTTFAAIALVLAGVGIFGLMHYSVVRRTHEIGVRTALGATAPQILKQFLREGLTLAGIGVAVGIAGAVVLLRAISSLLYQVSPLDPLSLGAAAVALFAIAALACLLPALRASRIDPMTALRVE